MLTGFGRNGPSIQVKGGSTFSRKSNLLVGRYKELRWEIGRSSSARTSFFVFAMKKISGSEISFDGISSSFIEKRV